jgi:hypothetical protein
VKAGLAHYTILSCALTGAAERRRRLEREMAEKQRIYGERYPIDALALMPPVCGVALGLDRLVMPATGASRIDQVLWTPIAGTALQRHGQQMRALLTATYASDEVGVGGKQGRCDFKIQPTAISNKSPARRCGVCYSAAFISQSRAYGPTQLLLLSLRS